VLQHPCQNILAILEKHLVVVRQRRRILSSAIGGNTHSAGRCSAASPRSSNTTIDVGARCRGDQAALGRCGHRSLRSQYEPCSDV